MNLEKEIKKIVKNGTASDALLLASAFKKARRRDIFLVISECPKESFKALKYINEAKHHSEVILSACQFPEFARVIVEDLPTYRTSKIFKLAIDDDPYWAKYYLKKYSLTFPWIKTLAKAKFEEKANQPAAVS